MLRPLAVFFGMAVVALIAFGCASVVPLTQGYYPAQLDTGEVQVIDARQLDRASIERVLAEHFIIGRFDASIPAGDHFEQELQKAVENGKPRILKAGGRVLMYTDNAELIAVIRQDARYAGAPNAITMYVMLRRG